MIKSTKLSAARMLMQDAQDIYFREKVRTRVFQVLSEAPAITFDHILKRSLNCDPAFLVDVLHELEDADFISSTKGRETSVRYWLKLIDNHPRPKPTPFTRPRTRPPLGSSLNSPQAEYLRELLQEMLHSLPEPAPVYCQWWFSESIYENLIKLVLHLSKRRTPLAFLGSGTLGALLSHFSTNPVNIFDVDGVLLERISRYCSKSTQAIGYDVSHEPDASFKNAFNFVFVDPPWSSDLLRTFLIRSSTLVSLRGTLAISFPPVLTRPSAESERKELVNLAKSLGLSLKSKLPSFTEYLVPAFERNAYERCGIHLKEPWRRGDLFIFTKNGDAKVDVNSLVEKIPEWNQYQHGERRLFLKRDGLFEDGPPSVEPISGLEDLTYKSTSSRIPFWKLASLISTRNRIAYAFGRKELSILLDRSFKKTHTGYESKPHFPPGMPREVKKSISDMFGVR